MGHPRPRPERLAEKLRQIRLALGLSLNEMHKRLEAEELIASSQISQYESDSREPPLQVLLRYARLANVYMEALVDDDVDLPTRLPSPTKTEGHRPKPTSRKR